MQVFKLKRLTDLTTVLLVLSLIPFASAQEENRTDFTFKSALEELVTSVYCYCGCTREKIQQCVCQTAQGIEDDFRRRLTTGQTVEQIRNAYLAAHGTQYSALMPLEGFNIVAYTMPAVIIVLLGVIAFAVIKSKRKAETAPQSDSTPSQSVSVNRYKEIEEEIERQKQRR